MAGALSKILIIEFANADPCCIAFAVVNGRDVMSPLFVESSLALVSFCALMDTPNWDVFWMHFECKKMLPIPTRVTCALVIATPGGIPKSTLNQRYSETCYIPNVRRSPSHSNQMCGTKTYFIRTQNRLKTMASRV